MSETNKTAPSSFISRASVGSVRCNNPERGLGRFFGILDLQTGDLGWPLSVDAHRVGKRRRTVTYRALLSRLGLVV